jgi:hypothetical protein
MKTDAVFDDASVSGSKSLGVIIDSARSVMLAFSPPPRRINAHGGSA